MNTVQLSWSDRHAVCSIPSAWISHLPNGVKYTAYNGNDLDNAAGMPSASLFAQWYDNDPSWADWNQWEVSDKVACLRSRVKILRQQWAFNRDAFPIPLKDTILKLLCCVNQSNDKKMMERDMTKLLAAVVRRLVQERQNVQLGLGDAYLHLTNFPPNIQQLFEDSKSLASENFDSWQRRLTRLLDEKYVETQNDAIRLSAKTAHMAKPVKRPIRREIDLVIYDTPDYIAGDNFGLCRSLGARETQLDDYIYGSNGNFFGVLDGHGSSDQANLFFKEHIEKRITEELETTSIVYNAVLKALLDLQDEWEASNPIDGCGLVYTVGYKNGEGLHLFSLGDTTALLCSQWGSWRLFPQHRIRSDQKNALVLKVVDRGGKLVEFRDSNYQRLSNGKVALESMGAFGDEKMPGIIHRPFYRFIPTNQLRDKWLILTSDGVGDRLGDFQTGNIVTLATNCEMAAQEIVKKAVAFGGERADNTICMVMKF